MSKFTKNVKDIEASKEWESGLDLSGKGIHNEDIETLFNDLKDNLSQPLSKLNLAQSKH
jgi:Zn-dependent M32 family carboxypeptidase